MKERPILFSEGMIKAILEGRKTQTRRVMKPQPEEGTLYGPEWYNPEMEDKDGELYPGPEIFGVYTEEWGLKFPYGAPGDRLWVREAFREMKAGYDYKADYPDRINFKWQSPIYMPRSASRITLEITRVRAEHIQDITLEDCLAEGVPQWAKPA